MRTYRVVQVKVICCIATPALRQTNGGQTSLQTLFHYSTFVAQWQRHRRFDEGSVLSKDTVRGIPTWYQRDLETTTFSTRESPGISARN